MAAGIDVHGADGVVRITARSPGGTVKLTVTKDYARSLAKELLRAAGGTGDMSPDWAQDLARAITGRPR